MNNFRHHVEKKKDEILGNNGRTVETLPSETHRQVMRRLLLLRSWTSLRTVSGFFNVPQNLYVEGLWEGAYGFSSLPERTRKSKGTFHLSELASRTSQLANEIGFFQTVFAENVHTI